LFCDILSFPKFTFSLEPKLLIPSGWAAIFFPDFPGAISDFSFLRLRHSAGSLFQFVSQGQYAADRFVVADPLRKLAVLIGLGEKMADDLFLIHCALHLNKTMEPRNCSSLLVSRRELLGGFRRSGTQAGNQPLAAPKLNVIGFDKALGLFDGLNIIVAN
jgi:hypothetical protein